MRFKFLLNFVLLISKWRPFGCQEITEEEWLAREDPEYLLGLSSEIDTYYGRVKGFKYNDSYGHEHQSFSNIPYAKKPIGLLRFKPPQPPRKWEDVLDASLPLWDEKSIKRCTQYLNWSDRVGKKLVGSEDCLYLDIIRPGDIELVNQYRQHAAFHDSKEADVVVILNTGTFMYDIPLSRQRVAHNLCCTYTIFVFVRYRLGPFGFMTTNDAIMPANLGMLDQIAALKWVQRTIVHFHGEPNKVTLAGAGAAAASVHLHMLSPLSEGLFKKAISVSGTALNPWAVSESADQLTKDYATRLNCSTPPLVSKTEMRDCLLTKPALDIADQYDLAFIYRNLPISAFAPTVDYDFLQAPPHILMRGASQQNIPWLVSFTKEEGIFPLMDWIDREPYRQVVDEEWDTLAPYLLDFYASVGEEQYSNLSQIIRKHYLKGDSSESLIGDYQHLNLLRNMVSDRLFKTGIVEAARLQARGSDAKVYLYEYSYKGEFSMARLLARDPDDPTQIGVDIPEMLQGTGHMEDFLIYINGYTTAKPTLPEDKQMKNTLTWLWSSFITDGVPELVVNPENPDENVKLIDVLDDIPNEPEYRDEIRWTHISFPGQYTFERSPFIAEKSFWRRVRTNDFPEH